MRLGALGSRIASLGSRSEDGIGLFASGSGVEEGEPVWPGQHDDGTLARVDQAVLLVRDPTNRRRIVQSPDL